MLKLSDAARSESGQSLVLISIALVILLGFAGLAIDGGTAYSQRRQMQNAADTSALAGARELDIEKGRAHPDQDPIWLKINEYAVTRNGASSFTATYYPTGQTIAHSNGIPPSGATGVCVTTREDITPFFLGMIGIPSLQITARSCAAKQAVASCMGNYAIWADAQSCDKNIDWSGGKWQVTGNIHSNNDMAVSGTGNQVAGQVEYVTGSAPADTKMTATAKILDQVRARPVTYNIEDFRPGGAWAVQAAVAGKYTQIAGNWNYSAGGTVLDGIYYVSGNVGVSASGVSGAFTIVSEGTLNWSGGTANISPYADGLLFFSNYQYGSANQQCTNNSMNISGSNSTWRGVMYAPRGRLQMSGSSNSSAQGSLIGYAIHISGSEGKLSFAPQYCPASTRPRTFKFVTPP